MGNDERSSDSLMLFFEMYFPDWRLGRAECICDICGFVISPTHTGDRIRSRPNHIDRESDCEVPRVKGEKETCPP